LVKTSLGSDYTDKKGNFNVKASLGREDIKINGPKHLESGLIWHPGYSDTTIVRDIARTAHSETWDAIKDELLEKIQNQESLLPYREDLQTVLQELDEQKGIDKDYFRTWILANRRQSYEVGKHTDGIFYALTEESVPDTFYIGGDIYKDVDWQKDPYEVSKGFQNVEQLNEIAKTINEEGNALTNGLISEDRTTIAICDSNFVHSTAKFAYGNMVVVPEDEFPREIEQLNRSAIIRGSKDMLGGNVTYYNNDTKTVTGLSIILEYNLTPDQINGIISEEFYACLVGEIESEIGYPSIIERWQYTGLKDPSNHDIRMMNLIIERGPGRIFPDLPQGFK